MAHHSVPSCVITVSLTFAVCTFLKNLDLNDVIIFRLDALAWSVIAMATWLAWWLSHSGIVSKPLNLSENFFDRLKAPSF